MGYDLVKRQGGPKPLPIDFDKETSRTIEAVQSHTLTTPERVFALCQAVRYLERTEVPGAIVECGVWRGGSMMAVARTLLELGSTDRDLYLFDTFSYMPKPTGADIHVSGRSGADIWDEAAKTEAFPYLPFEEVRAAVGATGYPPSRLHFIEGLVEDTLPRRAPSRIALCRLDTDWYESTRHELRTLVPLIACGGVLLIDDYGEFLGARRAVDEYVAETGLRVLLQRIDRSGRLAVMPGLPEAHGAERSERPC